MSKTAKINFSSLQGLNFVDILDYDQQVHKFLLSQGAVPYDAALPLGILSLDFSNLQFTGQKPVRFMVGNAARIFFPTKDHALIFSVVFGHKIFKSQVKEITDLIEGNTHD